MASSANIAKKRLTKSTPTPTKQEQRQEKLKPRSTRKAAISDSEDDFTPAGSSESASEFESTSDSEEEEEEEEEEEISVSPESDEEYYPPSDFLRLPPPSPSHRNPFSSENLAGKELWLISAPASAPLSKLGSINAADLLDNAQVLGTNSGRMFSVRETDEGAGVQVLGSDEGGRYLLGESCSTTTAVFGWGEGWGR